MILGGLPDPSPQRSRISRLISRETVPPRGDLKFASAWRLKSNFALEATGKQLRLSVLPLFLLLASCSAALNNFPQAAAVNPPDPSSASVAASLKTVATEAKLELPWEMSAPIDAPAISSARWLICLRSAASDESRRRTYSVFFKNDDFVSSRISAVIEPCGAQAFTLLK